MEFKQTPPIESNLDVSMPLDMSALFADDEPKVETQEVFVAPIEHSIDKPPLMRRLAHTAFLLTHPRYSLEVRQKAKHAARELKNAASEKQVLPPKSRDFDSFSERRRITALFAYDVARRIARLRRIRLALGGSSTVVARSETLSTLLLVPPEVEAVEIQDPPLDGELPSDIHFIPKLITKP